MNIAGSRRLKGASAVLGFLVCVHCTTLAWPQEIRYFGVTSIDGYLEIGYRYREEERQRSAARNSSQFEEMELNQRLGLNMTGYSLHPRFLEYHLGADFAYLRQRNDDHENPVDSSSDFLLGGDFDMTLFKDLPYTFSVYASRSEVETDQLFNLTYTAPRTRYGGAASVQLGPLPFTLSYDHSSLEGEGGASDLSETDDRVTLDVDYHLGERSRGRIRAFGYFVDQSAFNRSTEQLQLDVDNTTYLDKDKKMRLDGNVQLSSRTGTTDTTMQRYQERLHWRHTENLFTRYSINLNQLDVGSNSTQIKTGQFSLNHRLYESLTTNVNLNTSTTESNEQSTVANRIQLTEDYTKRLGGWGSLDINARVSTDTFDTTSSVDTIEIHEEPLALNGTLPVALAQTNAIVSSIRVTDSRGITPYTEGIDYTVTTIGQTVFIARLVFGAIADGDTVLVTYRFDADLELGIRTSTGSFRAQVTTGHWLTVHGGFTRTRQSVISGTPPDTLEDLKRQDYGIRFRWRWLDTKIEYQKVRSAFTPYHTLSQSVTIAGKPYFGARASVSVNHREQVFFDSGEELESWGVQGAATGRIAGGLRFEMLAEYRLQEWTPKRQAGGNEIYGLSGSVYWRYRGLSSQLRVLYSNMSQNNEQEERTEIELRVRRDF